MKHKLWVFISICLFICSICLYICLDTVREYYNGTDISLYPVKNTDRVYKKEKTWLISYGSDGVGPAGIHVQNESNLMMSASMYQVFDVMIPYQFHNIEPEYYEKHKEILSQKRGAGYWLWKPYLILKTLEMMPENDVLVWLDSSVVLGEGIYEVLKLVEKDDIILFYHHKNRGYTKKILVDKIFNGDKTFLDKAQFAGGYIFLRNNPKTRKFVEEWLHYSEDPELFTDIPSIDEYPDFKDHRHDQSILTAVYYQHGLLAKYASDYIPNAFLATGRKDQCSMTYLTFHKEPEQDYWSQLKAKIIDKLLGCQKLNPNGYGKW